MRKRIIIVISTLAMILMVFVTCFFYYTYVTDLIYKESKSHLTEIYHQANQSVHNFVHKNLSTMKMWAPYIVEIDDDEKIDSYINNAKAEIDFSDFYFISKDGNYLSIKGREGHLNLYNNLNLLINQKKDIVCNSVVPGEPETMLFAIPIEETIYRGFNYEAIGICFDNDDFINALSISAFEGNSNSFIFHNDGNVIVDNVEEDDKKIYNLFGTLSSSSNLNDNDIQELENKFKENINDVTKFKLYGIEYFCIYESVGFDDWIIVSFVPVQIVNANMHSVQLSTLGASIGIALLFSISAIIYLVLKYKQTLSKKDKELLFREELFACLSNNVDDIFGMISKDTLKVDYISPNIERVLGISQKDIYLDTEMIKNLKNKDTYIKVMHTLNSLSINEQVYWDSVYLNQKTNDTIYFKMTAMFKEIRGESKYILVMSDHTKDKLINNELENAINLANTANKAKSTFLSNMSHDIRTPMNAIIGFTTLALSNVNNYEKTKDYLNKILSSSNHLLSLINDVLDMSRIESGKMQIIETEANLSDLLHNIRNIIGGQIQDKQMDLFMEVIDVIHEDVYLDKVRMNQVLINIISNSIKYTPPGGKIRVSLRELSSSNDQEGCYEIRVSDTGIGMSQEFVDRIFEPFERELSSTVNKIQGTGLGMTISKNIIDMMNGTIEVHSKIGQGTEVVIRLNLRLQQIEKPTCSIKELEGLKALVVDDDYNTCDSVTKMLINIGMHSEWTLFGKEAILRAKHSQEMNNAFNVYIIDWRLPDMNGIEVARQIRSYGDKTPIIIITAYDWTDIEEEAHEAGVSAFCPKPMFMSDLRDSLLTALKYQKQQKDSSIIVSSNTEKFIGKRMLLVEDNELNMEIANEILSIYGFVITIAKNGKDAVDIIANSKKGDFDFILMDIQMPIMDGYQATKAIRALNNKDLANIPIIAMTANAFIEDRNKALECGMNSFISKPINIQDVISAISDVLKI